MPTKNSKDIAASVVPRTVPDKVMSAPYAASHVPAAWFYILQAKQAVMNARQLSEGEGDEDFIMSREIVSMIKERYRADPDVGHLVKWLEEQGK